MRRQGSLGNTIILENIEDNRKRGRPIMKWIDSIKRAKDISLGELNRPGKDRTLWTSVTRFIAVHLVVLMLKQVIFLCLFSDCFLLFIET